MTNIEIIDFLKEKFRHLNDTDIENMTWYWEDDSSSSIEENYEWVANKCGAASFKHGATKLVLFFEEISDYVIKIPFRGVRVWDFERNDEGSFFEFEMADEAVNVSMPVDSNNYCSVEEAVYHEAELYGVEECFARTFFLSYINDIPVYLAERVTPNNIPFSEEDEDILTSATNIKRETDSVLDEYTLARFIKDYGISMATTLAFFLTDTAVDDLHYFNLGWRNNKLVILDYSNYVD